MKTLNELAKEVHQANAKWWLDIHTGKPLERNPYELLMLVITELAEAMEGERKDLMDDKLPHRKMAEMEMADAMIRLLDFAAGFEYELPSFEELIKKIGAPPIPKESNRGEALLSCCMAVVRTAESLNDGELTGGIITSVILIIKSYCATFGYDLMGAYEEKMAYNATRADHTHEARLKAGGKKF